MLDFSAQAALARMPRNAPERCLYLDHTWQWGPYRPVAFMPVYGVKQTPPALEPIAAWRSRICVRCGCEQAENYDGSVRQIVADPSGIERRIKRI